MTDTHKPKVFCVIPAAGKSIRMGTPKQLLPFGNSTILETVIESVHTGEPDAIVVVTNSHIHKKLDLPENTYCRIAILPEEKTEMIDSIILGVETICENCDPDVNDAFMVCPGDVAKVSGNAVRSCIQKYRQKGGIVVASHEGRPGHPIVVPLGLKDELPQLHGTGLKQLLTIHAEKVSRVEVDSAISMVDIDTREDYERLLKEGPFN